MMNDQERILLLHQLWTGKISEKDHFRLEEELSRDEAFRKEAKWLESVWVQSGGVEAKFPVDTFGAWERFRKKMHAPRPQARRFRLPTAWRAAAAVALVILAWFAVRQFTGNDSLQIKAKREILASYVLPDQSVVWLNRGSTLEYPESFDPAIRRVVLRGEAYFEVDADPSHPFVIETPQGIVRVTGTKFNVRAYEDEDFEEVFVEEGRVSFQDRQGNETVNLVGGQRSILKKSTLQPSPPMASERIPIYWALPESWDEEGWLIFDDVPLENLLDVVERTLHVTFDTGKLTPRILACKWTLKIQKADLNNTEEVLKLLNSQIALTFVQTGNRLYRVTGGTCPK